VQTCLQGIPDPQLVPDLRAGVRPNYEFLLSG